MGDGRWALWRQDDNGNRFLVARFAAEAAAAAEQARFEALGHKQTYWVERDAASEAVDVDADDPERVRTRADFIRFVKALRDDWKRADRGPADENPWRNETIGDLLDAIAAFAADSPILPDEADWRLAAELLYAGKIYE